MSTVRIAHLSDLHFVREKQDHNVWSQVLDHVNGKVKPHAILVTGDVTDSATHDEFAYAKSCLDQLRTQPGGDKLHYRIVAGNHDRFFYRGNKVPLVGRLFGSWVKDKAARFDSVFKDHLVTTSPCELELESQSGARVPWLISLIGLDSCEAPRHFAQGALNGTSINAAGTAASAATNQDLVILLVHHHVLPIPAVEEKMLQRGLAQLVNATGMLNAGSLMKRLSQSHVDIVLHGHEHAAHQARFAGSDDLAGDVAVLSAGSATGDETLKGWALHRVHFNVIELDDDRSVWLTQVTGKDNELKSGARKLLLQSEGIRKSRFVRRNRHRADRAEPLRNLPTSRVRKVMEFLPNRDIILTEAKTSWAVRPTWAQPTASGSGIVSEALVRFHWPDSNQSEPLTVQPLPGERPGEYVFGVPSNVKGFRLADRVVINWRWVAAAVFTQRELHSLPKTARTGPRAQNREFAAINVADDFEELVLAVHLPLEVAPRPEDVEVYYEKPGSDEQVYAAELKRHLDFCGDGHLELRVPYPMPAYRYGISWPLPQRDTTPPDANALIAKLRSDSGKAGECIAEALRARGWDAGASWGLYAPDKLGGDRLLRINGAPSSPDSVFVDEPQSLVRAAYWGGAISAAPNGQERARSDFLSGEALVGLVPIRYGANPLHEALALVRIGFSGDPAGNRMPEQWFEDFSAFARDVSETLARHVKSR